MSQYDTSINDTLHRYYEKAKVKSLERRERSRGTVSRSASSLSGESQILGNIEREYGVKISESSDQLVDATTSAEVAKKFAKPHQSNDAGKGEGQIGKAITAEDAEGCC